jgi:hypothetical protein
MEVRTNIDSIYNCCKGLQIYESELKSIKIGMGKLLKTKPYSRKKISLFNSFAQMVQVDSIFWRPTPKRRANPA